MESEMDIDILIIMEEIIDKLKLLEYESQFLKKKINKPLSRTFFALKSSTGDQFVYFGTLSIWLLNLCGSSIQSKLEDPNSTSQNILLEMKNLGIDSNIPPNKLLQGYGEYVCIVLIRLINKALEKKKLSFKKVKEEGKKTQVEETNIIELEDEDLADNINKEIDFGDNILASNLKNQKSTNVKQNEVEDEEEDDTKIYVSDIPKADWLREVDRVASKLKLEYDEIGNFNSTEWRAHVEKIKINDSNLSKNIPESRAVLESLSEDIEKILEIINRKESMISKSYSEVLSEYKGKQKETSTQMEEFNNLKSKVDRMVKDYEELEDKKNELEVLFLN